MCVEAILCWNLKSSPGGWSSLAYLSEILCTFCDACVSVIAYTIFSGTSLSTSHNPKGSDRLLAPAVQCPFLYNRFIFWIDRFFYHEICLVSVSNFYLEISLVCCSRRPPPALFWLLVARRVPSHPATFIRRRLWLCILSLVGSTPTLGSRRSSVLPNGTPTSLLPPCVLSRSFLCVKWSSFPLVFPWICLPF